MFFSVTLSLLTSQLTPTNGKRKGKMSLALQVDFHPAFDLAQLIEALSRANTGGSLWLM